MTPLSGNRTHNNLIALGSAAVIAVYATGFAHTRAAAAAAAADADVNAEVTAQRPSAPEAGALAPVGIAPAAQDAPPIQTPGDRALAARRADSSVRPANGAAATAKEVAATAGASTVARAADSASALASSVTPVPAATVAVAAPVVSDSTRGAPAQVVVDTQPKLGMPAEHYKDGLFKGYGTSRHGDILVGVKIVDGRIVDAYITVCGTEYTCDVISMLPDQVMARQSTRVDRVSGATDSSQAFTKAMTDALSKAKGP